MKISQLWPYLNYKILILTLTTNMQFSFKYYFFLTKKKLSNFFKDIKKTPWFSNHSFQAVLRKQINFTKTKVAPQHRLLWWRAVVWAGRVGRTRAVSNATTEGICTSWTAARLKTPPPPACPTLAGSTRILSNALKVIGFYR